MSGENKNTPSGNTWEREVDDDGEFTQDTDTEACCDSNGNGTVDGLNGPYTYSDMTGGGLGLVTLPPTE